MYYNIRLDWILSIVVLCKANECVGFVKFLLQSLSQFSGSIFISCREGEQYANRRAFKLIVPWSSALTSTYTSLFILRVYISLYYKYLWGYVRENVYSYYYTFASKRILIKLIACIMYKKTCDVFHTHCAVTKNIEHLHGSICTIIINS